KAKVFRKAEKEAKYLLEGYPVVCTDMGLFFPSVVDNMQAANSRNASR
ncbi:unnamed protein product, partial [marine sediment metagenome]